ncbi:MAG: MFS transporter [Peptococcaceae bacterium]|nr:MFS transporter [Peptococcaceae bacterium]
MDRIQPGTPSYKKVLTCMMLGSLTTFAVLYSPQPLMALFSEQFHISASTASLSISFAAITMAVCLLIFSILANRWGRKRIMSLSLIGTSCLAILSSLSQDFHIFLVIRLLEGFTLAGYPATAMAYLNEEMTSDSIGPVIGIYVAGNALGGFFGRVIIGALTDLFAWNAAFFALGILGLACSLWFWRNLPVSKHFTQAPLSVFGTFRRFRRVFTKELNGIYAISFIHMGLYTVMLNYIGYPLSRPPYHLSQTLLGFLFVLNLVGTYSAPLFGRLSARYSRLRLIFIAYTIIFAGALLTLPSPFIIKLLGLLTFLFGCFAGNSITNGWSGILAPLENKAEAASLYLLFFYSGASFIGWGGGFFWTHWGWPSIVGLLCVLAVSSMILGWFVQKAADSRAMKGR